MIVRFAVENFLSFKEKSVVNFQAGMIKEFKENLFPVHPTANEFLLKSVGIFGHNASGKSNLIKALSFMREFVLTSSKESNSSQPISIQPFLLSSASDKKSSTFEITFFLDDLKYRYGFSLNQKFVESEWLFFTEKRKEEKIFIRAGQEYNFEKTFRIGLKGKFELFSEVTRPNALFLSVLAQFNSTLCLRISNWFNEIIIAHDTAHLNLIEFTANLMATGDYRKLVNDIIRKSDLGISNVVEKPVEKAATRGSFNDFVTSIKVETGKSYRIATTHVRFNNKNEIEGSVDFDLVKNESFGTQKFFGILGPILLALKTKKIILIDEIDARVHSLLLEQVITLFNSKNFNPNGAQLVFTSHNTTILKKGLRRDQMLFVEKNTEGASKVDSLYSKDPKVRNDASFDKDYLLGKYGAIPNLGSQLNLF